MEADLMPGEHAKASNGVERLSSSGGEVFDAMPGRFDPGTAAGVDLVVQFVLDGDGGGVWVVTIRDSRLSVSRAASELGDAGVTIRAAADDYLKIANGELAGADAFSTQRLTVDGDLSLAIKLAEMGLM
jgi:putative sterol carrier protein